MDSKVGGAGRIREVTEAPEDDLVVSIPTDLAQIEPVVEAVASRCRDYGLDRHSAEFNLKVALSEALANAMLYGNGLDSDKFVDVEAKVSDGDISVTVRDQGSGFDPDSVPDPTSPDRVNLPDGRGIFLIRKLVDDVIFSDRGNAICMVLRRS